MNYSKPFKGVFDGNNHIITGLYINNSLEYVGLFGVAENAIIKNLSIENAYIEVDYLLQIAAGCLTGLVYNSAITNCWSSGTVYATSEGRSASAGGISGVIENSTVSNCYSTASVNSYSLDEYAELETAAGGIAGFVVNNSTIVHCFSTGDVNSFSTDWGYAGGVVGKSYYNCSIANCYATGDVSSSSTYQSYSGGVVGYIFGGEILFCYSTGKINSSSTNTESYTGGVAGYIDGSNSKISNCAALNESLSSVTSEEDNNYYGRVLGLNYNNNATLFYNIGFNNMINPDGTKVWENIGTNDLDGADISIIEIHANSTLGDRFTAQNGWTTANGKLPGLFGNTVDMPEHLMLTNFPPVIMTESLPDGAVGIPYSVTIAVIGSKPITWSIVGGSLPDGLTLNPETGEIAGIPTEAVISSSFWVEALNAYGNDIKALSITITESPVTPQITTTELPVGEKGEPYSVFLAATGTAPITWSVVSGSLPDGLSLDPETGEIWGTPETVDVYYFSVKAENIAGSDTQILSIEIKPGQGIEQFQITNYELRIYPNPTSGQLTISDFPISDVRLSDNRKSHIEIYDITGRVVFTSLLSLLSPETVLDITCLPAGVYFLRVGNETVKVVKR